MSVASQVAIAVAERVERTGGPRAGLVAWRALIGATEPETRARAILSGLRCAIALADLTALSELTLAWESVDRGVFLEQVIALAKEMSRAGFSASAVALADAECHRHRTARALYLRARLLESQGESASAAQAFLTARERATAEGDSEIVMHSRVRRAAILARSWSTMVEALTEATLVDLDKAPSGCRLIAARVLLMSPSRFSRATAIGVLGDLANGEDESVAQSAIATVSRWTDDAASDLTPLELDRLVALFGRERAQRRHPRGVKIARALASLQQASTPSACAEAMNEMIRADPAIEPLIDRAKDLLRGRVEVVHARPPPAKRLDVEELLLDVAVAIRDGAPARAARDLTTLLESKHTVRTAWILAELALHHEHTELRKVAVEFFARRLARPSGGAPPRGYLALADALSREGREELAATARVAAAVRREAGAVESLGIAISRSGWELARRGDRAGAIVKLREAKVVFTRPS